MSFFSYHCGLFKCHSCVIYFCIWLYVTWQQAKVFVLKGFFMMFIQFFSYIWNRTYFNISNFELDYKTAGRNCYWKLLLETAGGNWQRKQPVETAGRKYWWKLHVETAVGNCHWKLLLETVSGIWWRKQQVETANGNCRWKLPVETVDGNCWWTLLIKTADGNCRWKLQV